MMRSNLIGQTEVVADTTTLLAEYAKTMSLIHHDDIEQLYLCLSLTISGKLATPCRHREHTVNNDEAMASSRSLRARAPTFHIVVW